MPAPYALRNRLGSLPDPTPSANPANSEYWWLAFVPRRLWNKPRQTKKYEIDFLPLPQQSVSVQGTLIKNGFLLTGISALVTNAVVPETLIWSGKNSAAASSVFVQVNDATVDYDFFSSLVPLDNVAGGSPQAPGIPIPYFVNPGSMVTVQALSLFALGVTQQNLRITLHGAEFGA